MPISYIICAAGEGTRFQRDFGSLPKALIKMRGRTFMEWALRSLPVFSGDQLIFITQGKHRLREKLQQTCADLFPFCHILWREISGPTRGQLETASLAAPYVPAGNALAIYNCDTYFQSRTLPGLLENPAIDGIVPCAEAEGAAWSFCSIDARNHVIDIREKERISPWASVGFYYFRDSEYFFSSAANALSKALPDEYYVAPLYQRYIEEGKTILVDKVSLFKPLGTPAQIERFWEIPISLLKKENLHPVLVVDLDNTITLDDPCLPYEAKRPNMPLIEKLREFSRAGWEIIIHTSRRMETFSGDESKVIADIGKTTLDWLQKYGVPCDGLKFGKPYARNGYYIDDKAITPQKFLTMKVS